ncbi:EAL domain, c-di-GMP-specific phosphodiesterase class I (or its enzymatically inactive variant) [Sphingomonas sp. OV641]|uniref:EAL domain-containing protein n=1 Tax=Sphingomonas sp. OV641 TaxID=1881068 RepID=UPI0008BA106E|nr:EAL domain-containing protein [Sphingomonas sp. OV641]SEI78510.1 EAL domain, c-di-GMP-specific phosphodiesterase class I (or its enzymatically inactive variant) [Sphingomonas sp. OV641]
MEEPEHAQADGGAANGYAVAFAPVAEIESGRIFAYEALLRTREGAAVEARIAGMDAPSLGALYARFRLAAVRSAASLGFVKSGARLIIDLPVALLADPFEELRPLIDAAHGCGIVPRRLVMRVKAPEQYAPFKLADLLDAHAKHGCATLYGPLHGRDDEFQRLTRLPPDFVEIDPGETQGIASSWARRIQVENLSRRITGASHGARLIASGVSADADAAKLRGYGFRYISGDVVGAPELGALPASRLAVSKDDAPSAGSATA